VPLDVTEPASVAAAAAAVAAAARPLAGVVLNAGVAPPPAPGAAAATFAANFSGAHACVRAFAPLLAPGGRIVAVGSGAGPLFVSAVPRADRKALLAGSPPPPAAALCAAAGEYLAAAAAAEAGDGGAALAVGGWPAAAGAADFSKGPYGASKAFLAALVASLAAEDPGLIINTISPGMIDTDLVSGLAASVGKSAADFGALPVEKSTVSIMHALCGDLRGARGFFFGSDAKRSPLDVYRSPGSPEYEPAAAV